LLVYRKEDFDDNILRFPGLKLYDISTRCHQLETQWKEEATLAFPDMPNSPLLYWTMTAPEISKKFFSAVYEISTKQNDSFVSCPRVGDIKLPKHKLKQSIEVLIANVIHFKQIAALTVELKYPIAILDRKSDIEKFEKQVQHMTKNVKIVANEKFRGKICDNTYNNDFHYAFSDRSVFTYLTVQLIPEVIQRIIATAYIGKPFTFKFMIENSFDWMNSYFRSKYSRSIKTNGL